MRYFKLLPALKHIMFWSILFLVIFFSYFSYQSNNKFLLENGIRVNGTYIGSKKKLNVYQHYYQFKTFDGEEVEFFFNDKKPEWLEKEDSVGIVYEKLNPQNAIVIQWSIESSQSDF